MAVDGNGRLRFGEFEFDSRLGILFRESHPVKIEPQPLRVLSLLLGSAGEIVSRERLRACVWGNSTFVEFDQGLNYCIRRIRLALRDDFAKPLYIETLPKQGYRFIASVSIVSGVRIPDGAAWTDGETVIPNGLAAGATVDPAQVTTPDFVSPPPAQLVRSRFPSHIPWVAAVSFALLTALGVWAVRRSDSRAQPDAPLVLLPIDLGTGVSLFADNGPALAISPDGSRIVFSSRDDQGRILLYWRPLDRASATALPGTESAFNPFFSPSGKHVAFFADGRLKTIELDTGIFTDLANADDPAGGSWGENDTIVLNRAPTLDLWAIHSNGEELTQLARDPRDPVSRFWPQVLPGGKAILFTGIKGQDQQGDISRARVEGMFLKDGRHRTLVEGASFGRYTAAGNLLYVRGGSLFARSFDAARLEVTGSEVPVLNGVETSSFDGAAQFDLSNNGTLVYRGSRPGSNFKTVAWMNSAGRLEPLLAMPGDYRAISLSPDGRRLALAIGDGSSSDVYVYDIQRSQEPARLTAGASIGDSPLVWSRDGRYIFFSARKAAWWIPSDTAAHPKQLVGGFHVSGITADGTRLFVTHSTPETRVDTLLLPFTEDSDGPRAGHPIPLLGGSYSEVATGTSADGRWVAYTADETGDPEIYVMGLVEPGLKWPVSHGSGIGPSWSRASSEIFYPTFFSPLRIMAAPYTMEGGRFKPGKPRLWSKRAIPGRTGKGDYIISQAPDGKRFAVLVPAEEARNNRVIFAMGFFNEIRRRLAEAK